MRISDEGLTLRTAPRTALLLLSVLVLLVGTGCPKTMQSRNVEPSGFLGDYSNLVEGEGDEALLVYVNSTADFSAYDKIQIDPVTIWVGEDSDLSEVPPEDLELLTNLLYTKVREQLEADYAIVDRAGPGTMRLRMALTEAEGSSVALDTVSSLVPQLRLLGTLGQLAAGTSWLTGKAGAEAEILDSLTGRRLLAGVDRRVGTKVLRGSLTEWDDVETAYQHWAERIQARLTELRSL